MGRFPKRLFRRLWKPTEALDTAFYAELYPDLRNLPQRVLKKHYRKYGLREGRFPSKTAFYASLKAYGPLEVNFDADGYLTNNPDLRAVVDNPWHALRHYMQYGRQEGRRYTQLDIALYKSLYFPSAKITDGALETHFDSVGRSSNNIANAKQYLESKGFHEDASWCSFIVVDEFEHLSFAWAGAVANKKEAIDAMLRDGIKRMASLSFKTTFDAVFYAAYASKGDGMPANVAYRKWLFEGLRHGAPGDEASFLRSLGWPDETFPIGFDAPAYQAIHSDSPTKWHALAAFLQCSASDYNRYLRGDAIARNAFLDALARFSAVRDDELALSVLATLHEQGRLSMMQSLTIADCSLRLGRDREALQNYITAMRGGNLQFFSYIYAIRIALRLKKIGAAFAILRLSKDRVVGAPDWRAAVREAIHEDFVRLELKSKALRKTGKITAANEEMDKAIERARAHFEELDPIGVPLPGKAATKVIILANTDLRQCTHYRVEQKALLLERMQIPYRIYHAHEVDDFISALPGAELAIFYRIPAFPMNIRAIETAKALGIATFYEVDDLIFEPRHYPEPFETYGGASRDFYESLQHGVPLFRGAMRLCDYGISSTTFLCKWMAKHVSTGKVFVLPNTLDRRNEGLAATVRRMRTDGDLVIFYGSGTKAHNSDFIDLAGPGLLSVLKSHARVRVVIAGYLTLNEELEHFNERFIFVDVVKDVISYWSVLAEADINLAVLAPSPTTNGKSEIKWLEAAVFGIPSIVSNTHRYEEVLTSGKNAIIACDADEWETALERLVADAEFRREIGESARETALELHASSSNVPRFEAILDQVKSASATDLSVKPRILVVNIFFPPQTVGGSTRVARDLVDAIIDDATYDVAVVASEFGAHGSGMLRVESYRGAPVFRVDVPTRDHMEWWAHSEVVAKHWSVILDVWKPDIVHFHCVERLTGAVVRLTGERGIPYVVSLHDAWWVADWHFLNDVKNQLRLPGESFPMDGPTDLGQSIDRRRELRDLLEGAQAIMAVSNSLAEMYRSCGFSSTFVVANGVPSLKPIERVPSPNGKVRLAHVGSKTKFKGYFLLQPALSTSSFPNLELTVIEHDRYGGSVRHEVWGSTHVKFVGKVIQEDMHEFYAAQDVLLAPSMWPEPYGLVSREAIAAGMWVIASDRGAIGEDVIDGENGWVIDVSTPLPLIEALAEINASPHRYVTSPPPVTLRTAADQAKQFTEIYEGILHRGSARPPTETSIEVISRYAGELAPIYDERTASRAAEAVRGHR